MDKRFAIVVLVVVSIIFSIFFITRKDNANTTSNPNGEAKISSHSKGTATGSVEVIEYGDFQCPACGSFFGIVEEVTKKYGDKIKFTFRHFPIDNIHPNARAAHRAAEAAGIQGKFFEMHDKLYSNQANWTDSSNPIKIFDGYASSLGLNMEKYKADFESEAVNNTIKADIQEAKNKYQVEGTPTFIINGQKVPNGELSSVEEFSKKIDALLKTEAPTQ